MWTGGETPPPLPKTPVKKIQEKDAQSPGYRSVEMENELEELRQRGLAKLLNKHFTETTRQLAIEKAEADAALNDLLARKARTSEFQASADVLGQFDKKYLQLREKQQQYRLKERETILLYQRYVHRFGNTKKIPDPAKMLSFGQSSNRVSHTPSIPKIDEDAEDAVDMVNGSVKTTSIKELSKTPDVVGDVSPTSHKEELVSELVNEVAKNLRTKTVAKSRSDPLVGTMEPASNTSSEVLQTCDDNEVEDDSSIISGLTSVNSAMTKEVLHEVENRLMDFIKSETNNIRRELMEEDLRSSASCRSSELDEMGQSTREAEDMVRKMQRILDDFKNSDDEAPADTKGRKVKTSDPNEEWIAYFDQTYQKEYYVETHTNKTQWEPPESSVTSDDVSLATEFSASSKNTLSRQALITHEDFTPDVRKRRRSSRIHQYRAKIRRQRNNQIAILVVIIACVGAGIAYYKHTHPDFTLQDQISNVNRVFNEARSKLPKRVDRQIVSIERKLGGIGKQVRALGIEEKIESIVEKVKTWGTEGKKGTPVGEEVSSTETFNVAKLIAPLKTGQPRVEHKPDPELEPEQEPECEPEPEQEQEPECEPEQEQEPECEPEPEPEPDVPVKESVAAEIKSEPTKDVEDQSAAGKKPRGCNVPLSNILRPKCRRSARQNRMNMKRGRDENKK